jgi:hypothetical protein
MAGLLTAGLRPLCRAAACRLGGLGGLGVLGVLGVLR